MGVDFVWINIRANPCVNRCRHCWAEGTPTKDRIPGGELKDVLRALANTDVSNRTFFIFDEPTFRDDFLAILEYARELGLIGDDFWFPSNGFGLALGDDKYWRRLRDIGLDYIQFTFYGIGEKHDEFARRKGAFKDLTASIAKTEKYGVPWMGAAVMQPGDAGDVKATVDYIRSLVSPLRSGHFFYMLGGRSYDIGKPRFSDVNTVFSEGDLAKKGVFTEYSHIERIKSEPELAARTADDACNNVILEVHSGKRAFYAGACDDNGLLGTFPEHKDQFYIGTVGDEGFVPMIERFLADPPEILRLFASITWGELAGRYGDPTNDELFYDFELVKDKWAKQYIDDYYRK